MTPRAVELLPELSDALASLATILERPDVFLPERIRRTFVLRANEVVIAAVGAELLRLASAEAPRSELRFELEAADDMAALRQGDVDLAIGSYSDATTDIADAALLDEQLVAVVRSDHPTVKAGSRPGLARYADLEHVVVSRKGRRRKVVDTMLGTGGVKRNVIAVVPSFSVALSLVARSNATTIAPSRLASLFLEHGALIRFTAPITLPAVTVSQHWHISNTADPTHRWLRSCVERAASQIA